MIKKLHGFYNDLNMRHKLFITYLLLISIPFLLFTIINNRVLSQDMEKQALHSSRQVFEQGLSYIEYKVDILSTYLNVLSLNDKIQEIVKKDSKVYVDNMGLWGFDLNEIRKQFVNTKPSMNITNTILYLNNSLPLIDETDDLIKISGVSNTNWYKRLLTRQNTIEWFVGSNEENSTTTEKASHLISAARVVQNSESLKEIIGVVRVDVPENTFRSLLDHVAFFKNSSVYMINYDNSIVSCSSSTQFSESFFAPEIYTKHSNSKLKSGVWEYLKLNGESYLVGIQSVKGTNWKMVITIPSKEILSSQSKTMRQMLLIILLIAPLMFPLALIGAASGTKRIRKLISHMRAVQKGDFDISILPATKDEIGELTQNFNTMITKISMLLDEKYKLGQEIKSIELKALQAQINPHFLYNTLDLIYWKAMRIKENSIYELVQSLSKFYKLSLSKGNDIVTIKNELEHIQAYVQIQNARFKNGINLIIDIPESLYICNIPKITLQPIIENSIIHGILETETETGTIRITGFKDEKNIILEIWDDGVGIPEEKLATLLRKESSDSLHGYGVMNIDRRIKLFYGEEYGISYESKPGAGTTVTIVIPANV